MNTAGHINITREALLSVGHPALGDARLDLIIGANLNEDTDEVTSAKHFDNCAFREGAHKIEKDRALITAASDRLSRGCLLSLGRTLHTLQDFYAHSNWIELHEQQAPIPLWDLHPSSLPRGITSGTWTRGKPKRCHAPALTHELLNKDRADSQRGRQVIRGGPNQGKTYWDLARQAAIDVSVCEAQRLLEGVTTYRVTTKTGDRDCAGTDADVFIVLYGPSGDKTGQIYLDNIDKDDFERGSADEFLIGVPGWLPEISRIKIGYEQWGPDDRYPGWYLDWVKVEEIGAARAWTFRCDRWLSCDEGDGHTVVSLPAVA